MIYYCTGCGAEWSALALGRCDGECYECPDCGNNYFSRTPVDLVMNEEIREMRARAAEDRAADTAGEKEA